MNKAIQSITQIILVVTLGYWAGAAMADGHGDAGAMVFRRCAGCHEVGPEARNKVGPHLNDIIGRPVGSVEGFRYSRTLNDVAEGGIVWTEEMLQAYVERPADLFPGTRMSFNGIRKAEDREQLIIFLSTLTPETNFGSAHLEPSDPVVSPEILAIEGDLAYGQYLSGTCSTCHQLSGADNGIPSILGWPSAAFVTVLHAYKVHARENPVMRQIAGSLSDEEIAALAAYYESVSE